MDSPNYFDDNTNTVRRRSCHTFSTDLIDSLDIYRQRFHGIVIYFLKSHFKFFNDASRHPADAYNARRYADRPMHY